MASEREPFDLSGCLRGDKRAWDAFVERYARVILAAVQRALRMHAPKAGDADVQDAAQEVFVRLVKDDFRLLRAYDPSRAALTTWLTIVSRSTAIDHVRRKRRATVGLEHAAEAEAAPPTAGRAAATEAVGIPEGLLSPRQQLVLRMLFDEEMSVEQVAAALGIEAQTVRSTQHKAISKLREHFRAS